MSYENDVEAENARLKVEVERWRDASGLRVAGMEPPEPLMLVLAINHQTAMLEQSQARERTALRERDEARNDARLVNESCDDWKSQAEKEKAARERAEADCAALRAVLADVEHVAMPEGADGTMLYCPLCGETVSGHDEGCALGHALHGVVSPGTALLERLRAADGDGHEVARLTEENRCLRSRLDESAAVNRAAVAVVEAARKAMLEDDLATGADFGPVGDALAAYDAMGAKGEAHTHNDPDANGCRPCDKADTEAQKTRECSVCGHEGHCGITCPEQA